MGRGGDEEVTCLTPLTCRPNDELQSISPPLMFKLGTCLSELFLGVPVHIPGFNRGCPTSQEKSRRDRLLPSRPSLLSLHPATVSEAIRSAVQVCRSNIPPRSRRSVFSSFVFLLFCPHKTVLIPSEPRIEDVFQMQNLSFRSALRGKYVMFRRCLLARANPPLEKEIKIA